MHYSEAFIAAAILIIPRLPRVPCIGRTNGQGSFLCISLLYCGDPVAMASIFHIAGIQSF